MEVRCRSAPKVMWQLPALPASAVCCRSRERARTFAGASHPDKTCGYIVYIEHLRIPVGAGGVHAERVGRGGPPIVLLHGFGTCAFLWRAVAPALANAGFTALSVDLMGYGESDRPYDAGYGIVAQAEYLDRALTALRLPRAVIVGQDIGALVGVQLAARRPERVARLMMVSPPVPDDLPGASIRSLQRAAARIALGAQGMFGTAQVLGPLLRAAVANPAHMTELLVARYTAPYVGAEGLSHLLLLARSLELADDEPLRLSSVLAPVRLLRGELDRGTEARDVEALAEQLAASGEEAGIETVVGAAALLAEDQPGVLARLIQEWANVPVGVRVGEVSQAGELSPDR